MELKRSKRAGEERRRMLKYTHVVAALELKETLVSVGDDDEDRKIAPPSLLEQQGNKGVNQFSLQHKHHATLTLTHTRTLTHSLTCSLTQHTRALKEKE